MSDSWELKVDHNGHGTLMRNGEPVENIGRLVITVDPSQLTTVEITYINASVSAQVEQGERWIPEPAL